MKQFRSVRWMLLALLLSLIPASSFAGVFISVGFAPPMLPVYEQPPCPEPGLMWSPGYWAYGDDGYYWVPGTWVPAPYEGALWTPPYWGWSSGLYVFHGGYWGPQVGYYGGVNYGFGYMGVGFVGGEWRGHDFAYNTAVMRVNRNVIRNTYINNTVVNNTTIVNNRVAYSGGPGGVRHMPTSQEQAAMRAPHVAPTSFQMQHIQAARADRSSYVKFNGGRPEHIVSARPLPAAHVNPPAGARAGEFSRPGGANGPAVGGTDMRPAPQGRLQSQPSPATRSEMRQAPTFRNQQQARPGAVPQYQPQNRPAAPQYQQQARPNAPQYQPQNRPAAPQYQQQARQAPQQRYEPQQRPAPEPRQQARPAPAPRPEPQSRPAPAPKQREPHR